MILLHLTKNDIQRIIDLIATEDKWCKGGLYRTKNGALRHHYEPGLRCCLAGAVRVIFGYSTQKEFLFRRLFTKHFGFIEPFNDKAQTTHADVIKALNTLAQSLPTE